MAHARFGIEFTDLASIGGSGWPMPANAVVEEVAWRTPGFSGWQQERWFTCCHDAAAFLGHAGAAELAGLSPEAGQAIALECGFTGDELKDYIGRPSGRRQSYGICLPLSPLRRLRRLLGRQLIGSVRPTGSDRDTTRATGLR
jgi:hypothetical protein